MMTCPDDAVCQTCPCAGEDDVCFPGERLRAERDALRAERDKLRAALEQARSDILAINRCGFDSTRRETSQAALDHIGAALKPRPDDPEWAQDIEGLLGKRSDHDEPLPHDWRPVGAVGAQQCRCERCGKEQFLMKANHNEVCAGRPDHDEGKDT